MDIYDYSVVSAVYTITYYTLYIPLTSLTTERINLTRSLNLPLFSTGRTTRARLVTMNPLFKPDDVPSLVRLYIDSLVIVNVPITQFTTMC